jgi:hypothetical protein
MQGVKFNIVSCYPKIIWTLQFIDFKLTIKRSFFLEKQFFMILTSETLMRVENNKISGNIFKENTVSGTLHGPLHDIHPSLYHPNNPCGSVAPLVFTACKLIVQTSVLLCEVRPVD